MGALDGRVLFREQCVVLAVLTVGGAERSALGLCAIWEAKWGQGGAGPTPGCFL